MTKPINIDEVYQMEVSGLSHEGAGIGRINNFAVFVDKAIPGEEVLVKITEVKKNFGKGELIEILIPSEDRIEATCTWFNNCGGCQLQHIKYSRQLELKRQMVEDALKKIGNLENEVLPTLGMDNPWRYRNKGVFQVGEGAEGIRLGFYEQGSYDFVPGKESFLFSEGVNSLVQLLEEKLNLHNIKPFDRKSQKGYLRNVMVRESKSTGEIMVVFITAQEKWLLDKVVEKVVSQFPMVVSVYQNINKGKSPHILGREDRLIQGKAVIQDTIGDFIFNISPQSFFQVNNVQANVLYKKALEYAQLTGKETIIDGYCGIGTITLFMARQAKKAIGIEIVADAIKDAEENAKINGVKNTEFILGKVEQWLPQWVKEGGSADVIVVDPPRKGCAPETLEAIAKVKPQRIVYVSCNPATLARDLKYLVEERYGVEEVQPVDMFPQTGHVECVILMQRSGLEDGK